MDYTIKNIFMISTLANPFAFQKFIYCIFERTSPYSFVIVSISAVASSKISTSGFLITACINAINCFWLKLILSPPDDTFVCKPFSKMVSKLCRLVSFINLLHLFIRIIFILFVAVLELPIADVTSSCPTFARFFCTSFLSTLKFF